MYLSHCVKPSSMSPSYSCHYPGFQYLVLQRAVKALAIFRDYSVLTWRHKVDLFASDI